MDWDNYFNKTTETQGEISDSILDKIRKLQRLSKSSNQNEAALAASKMQELLFKYNLSTTALLEPSEFVKEALKADKIWAEKLLIYIAQTNFCQPIMSHDHTVYVVGRRENTEVVSIMYAWLSSEIERMATEAWALLKEFTDSHGRTWKNGFRDGAVNTIKERLIMQRQLDINKIETSTFEGGKTGTEIIRTMNRDLDSAVSKFFPKLGYRSTQREKVRGSGYAMGQAAGARMSLRQSKGHIG